MPRFFSNKRLIVLLVGVILLVALISFTLRDRSNVTLPEQFVKDIAGFGQTIVSRPAMYVTGVVERVDLLLDTFEENKRLKARLDEYASVQAEAADLRLENAELRKLAEKQGDLRAYNPIQATVIARSPDQWEEKIILDKGESDGVSENMAVMTAQGLIGKVTLVTPFTSTVELVSTQNPNHRVSAMVLGDKQEVYGVVEGYDAERGELILRRINADFDIKPGQKVSSSGLGGIFPRGILIGEITEVSTDEFGLTKQAYVKPAAEFPNLNHVVIADREVPELDGLDGEDSATAEVAP